MSSGYDNASDAKGKSVMRHTIKHIAEEGDDVNDGRETTAQQKDATTIKAPRPFDLALSGTNRVRAARSSIAETGWN